MQRRFEGCREFPPRTATLPSALEVMVAGGMEKGPAFSISVRTCTLFCVRSISRISFCDHGVRRTSALFPDKAATRHGRANWDNYVGGDEDVHRRARTACQVEDYQAVICGIGNQQLCIVGMKGKPGPRRAAPLPMVDDRISSRKVCVSRIEHPDGVIRASKVKAIARRVVNRACIGCAGQRYILRKVLHHVFGRFRCAVGKNEVEGRPTRLAGGHLYRQLPPGILAQSARRQRWSRRAANRHGYGIHAEGSLDSVGQQRADCPSVCSHYHDQSALRTREGRAAAPRFMTSSSQLNGRCAGRGRVAVTNRHRR